MSVDLKDYPSIDIMNHILEIRRDLAGNPFAFKEFQIMLQTTFRQAHAEERGECGWRKGWQEEVRGCHAHGAWFA